MSGKHISITDTEWQMGIVYPQGMGRWKGLPRILKELKERMESLTPRFGIGTAREIENSLELEAATMDLFESVGPRLWPQNGREKWAWLADADNAASLQWLSGASVEEVQEVQEKLKTLYPRNLCYEKDADEYAFRGGCIVRADS